MNHNNYYKCFLFLVFFISPAESTEFNTEFLKIGDNASADLSQFSHAENIMPGSYIVDIIVNKNYLLQQEVKFFPGKSKESAVPCITREVIDMFGLKDEYLKKLDRTAVCLTPDQLPDIVILFKKSSSQLLITVPQILLQYKDSNYAPPSQWDNGIPGLLMDYRAVVNSRQNQNQDRVNSLSAFGTVGTNAGPWRLRSNYQYNQYSGASAESANSFDLNSTHLYRALPSIRSQLTLGQTYLSSNIFDTLSYTGVSMSSDDRMLPPSLRGYAPLITGIAKTNSKVTVSQSGRIIYMTTVPTGPFSIQDMNSSVQGTLDVKVEGEDGSVTQYSMNTASVPFLTRQGQVRYNLSAGKPSLSQNHVQDPMFAMSEISYGLSSTWSLYGGAIGANDYTSTAVGVGKDMNLLGAVSADVTQSRAIVDDDQQIGQSWRLNYSKRIDSLDTDLRFFGYRFSDSKFISLSDFSSMTNDQWQYANKQRYTVSIAKQVSSVSTYLSYSHDSYWNSKSTQRLDLNATTLFDFVNFKNVSLNTSLSYSENPTEGSNTREVIGYIGLSIPLENNQRVNYNLQTGRGRFDQTVSWRQNRGREDYYQLTGGGQYNEPMVSGIYQKSLPQAQYGLNGSYVSDSYNAISATLSGSMVATPKGSALHANGSGGNTRLLVDTQGVKDVWFNNQKTVTNRYGYGVIDGLPSYDLYEARLDVTRLPKNAETDLPIKRVVLTDGAIGYLPFEMNKGGKLLATLKMANQSAVPFGAEVNVAKSGKYVAVVGEDGLTWLTGLQPEEALTANWGENHCTLKLPEKLPEESGSPQILLCQ